MLNFVISNAATYYIKPSGNDSLDGLSIANAWQTISKVNSCNFLAGDIILFEADGVWREQLNITRSGTENNQITFGRYGDGDNPLFRCTDLISASQWSLVEPLSQIIPPTLPTTGKQVYSYVHSGVWRSYSLLDNTERRTSVYYNRMAVNVYDLLTDKQVGWGHNQVIYYRSDSGINNDLEVGMRPFGIFCNDVSNILITGIDCQGPNAVVVSASIAQRSPIYVDELCENIFIKNLSVFNASGSGIRAGYWDSAQQLVFGPSNVIYENLRSYDNGSTGIYHSGSGQILNCKIYNCANLPDDIDGDRGGIGIQGGPNLIKGNEIYNIGHTDTKQGDQAICLFEADGKVEIINNYIHDVCIGGIGVMGPYVGHVVAYNIINRFGNSVHTGDTSGKIAGIKVANATEVKIHNNVIANGGTHGSAIGLFIDKINDDIEVKNNIFYNNYSSDLRMNYAATPTGFVSDNNIFYKSNYDNNWVWINSYYDTLALWQSGQTQDSLSTVSDPTFKNASLLTLDSHFQLLTGSPAINTGSSLGYIFDYANGFIDDDYPDLGAWETGAEVTSSILKYQDDPNAMLILHLDEGQGLALDSSAEGNDPSSSDGVWSNSDGGRVGDKDNILDGCHLVMDGTSAGSGIIIPYDISLVPTDSFTFAGWFKIDETPSGAQALVSFKTASGNARFALGVNQNRQITTSIRINGTAYYNATAQSAITLGEWFHCAFTFKNDASDIAKYTLYLDSVNVVSETNLPGDDFWNPGNVFALGCNYISGTKSAFFKGAMDEIIWTKTYIDDNGIAEIYNRRMFPAKFVEDDFTMFALHLDEGTSIPVDSSLNGNDIINFAGTWQTGDGGTIGPEANYMSGYHISMDGTSSGAGFCVEYDTSIVPENYFTFSGWFRIDTTPSGSQTLVSFNSASGNTRFALGINQNRQITTSIRINGTAYYNATAQSVITLGEWFHVVFVYENDRVNIANYELYINSNKEVASFDLTGDAFWTPGNHFSIGCNYTNGQKGGFFNGYVDELIWLRKAISSTEIRELYHRRK